MVKKFGGTSVGSIERIEAVADRLVKDIQAGQKPIVVASAMSGETNRLVRLAYEINPSYRGQAYDVLLASGEQVAIALLAIALQKRNIEAAPLLAYQLGIKTDSIYSKARIHTVDASRLLQLVNSNVVPIVAGFQGIDDEDRITTLGRGGSDTTAVALAAATQSEACEIYTDVPAVFTADPRMVPLAREIQYLSFDEMMEMASLGSKVLHSRSVELAAKFNVKIHLRSAFQERQGTWVVSEQEMKQMQHSMETPVVSAVTHEGETAVIKIPSVPYGAKYLSNLFSQLAERGIVVDIISQSHHDHGQRLAFSIEEVDEPLAVEVVKKAFGAETEIEILRDKAKVSTVGVGMRNHPGVAARFFKVLEQQAVDLELVTTSDIKISAVIPRSELSLVAQALHTEFGLNQD